MKIQVSNLATSTVPKTFLAVSQNAAVGTIYTKNTNGFSANWAVQIGETGESQTEVILANGASPSGTQIVLAANTSFEHPQDTPVYAIKYNQVVFTKAIAGTTPGTSGAITNGTVGLTANFPYTQFDDTTASTTDYFRTYFLNSATTGSTSYSDWQSPAGYSFYSLASITNRVRNKLWDSKFIRTDDPIHDWINEWRDKMASAVTNLNEDFALGSVAVPFGTNGLGTITTADFDQPRRVWVSYDGVNNYQSTKAAINEYNPDENFTASHPYHAWLGDTVISINPGGIGTANIVYYQFGTTLVNDTDTLPQPMRPFTDSFVNYALAQALFKDDKMTEYDRMITACGSAKTDFVTKNANRDKTGPTYIKMVEAVDGSDGMPL